MGVFQTCGVCGQAFPFFASPPLPLPTPSFFFCARLNLARPKREMPQKRRKVYGSACYAV